MTKLVLLAGKTTLLALLAQALQPTAGTVQAQAGVKIGYLPQHSVDAARRRDESALAALAAAAPGAPEQALYAQLGQFGLQVRLFCRVRWGCRTFEKPLDLSTLSRRVTLIFATCCIAVRTAWPVWPAGALPNLPLVLPRAPGLQM